MTIDKKSLSERDICTKFITPALRKAGWDEMAQIREEVSFTKGRIIVRGKLVSRGKGKRADYILYYKPNIPIALIEAKGHDRILLVMATGTGKTYTAFQIIWRLWKAGRKKRILFLADRNVLIDQTMVNDFRPFKAAMTKLSTQAGTIERANDPPGDPPRAIEGKRRIDTAYEVYLGLYQAITGPEDHQKVFRELSPSFFDLIVIDECHRGSAAEDSAWREILEYFSSATQIGLTATPKETQYVSNIHYFGEPIYSYSLKQGICDGFLAPYKVIKVHIDRDVEGYRPEHGQLDRDGIEVEDRIYNTRDSDRTLVLDDRTKLVARKVTEFLKESGNRFQKAIVFCVDQEHAARMRQGLINENSDLVKTNHRYVMRITGADTEGQAQLGNFIDPESRYHVLVTTSQLLSMTEFKQIVGRGTRVHEDTRKFYFTLMDFRGATSHFADPDFDGEPVQIYEPGEDDPITPPDDIPPRDEDPIPPEPGEDETIVDVPPDITLPPDGPGRRKVYVDGVDATIVAERVEYLDENGKLVTESLRDFTKRALRKRFASLDEFLRSWKGIQRKQVIIEELKAEGLDLGVVTETLGKDLDPFDLICHVAFDAKPLTRRERAENVKKRDVFSQYGDQARAVLDALLAKYADEGVLNLEDPNVLRIPPFTELGTPVQLIKAFGGHEGFVAAVHDLQSALYREIA